MAASTSPNSRYVISFSDKSDEWVRTRLEIKENEERSSTAGSLPRRKEIRLLRVELLNRKKAAAALNGATVLVSSLGQSVAQPRGQASPARS